MQSFYTILLFALAFFNLSLMGEHNDSEIKSYRIPDDNFKKYNKETCFQIIFTEEGLIKLRNKYHTVKGLPGFLHNLMKGRPVREREVLINYEHGFMWTPDRSALTIPNFYVNLSNFTNNPRGIKDLSPEGLTLVSWVMNPKLLDDYGWNFEPNLSPNESFKKFLQTHDNTRNVLPNYRPMERRDSQQKIGDIESSGNTPYIASILDLNPSHLPFLKSLRESNRAYLTHHFGVDFKKDNVEMFFHFPYPEGTVTLHLHVRVNQGRHPMERYRSFSLDEIIDCLERKQEITDLIFKKPFFSHTVDFLRDVEGITLVETKNPYFISSPTVDSKSREILSY